MNFDAEDRKNASALICQLVDSGVKFDLKEMEYQRNVVIRFFASMRKEYQAGKQKVKKS